MADREHLVYQAKLAEQAERYDGPRWPNGSGCIQHRGGGEVDKTRVQFWVRFRKEAVLQAPEAVVLRFSYKQHVLVGAFKVKTDCRESINPPLIKELNYRRAQKNKVL